MKPGELLFGDFPKPNKVQTQPKVDPFSKHRVLLMTAVLSLLLGIKLGLSIVDTKEAA